MRDISARRRPQAGRPPVKRQREASPGPGERQAKAAPRAPRNPVKVARRVGLVALEAVFLAESLLQGTGAPIGGPGDCRQTGAQAQKALVQLPNPGLTLWGGGKAVRRAGDGAAVGGAPVYTLTVQGSPQAAPVASWKQRASATEAAMDRNYLTRVGLYEGVDFAKQRASVPALLEMCHVDWRKVWAFTQPGSTWALSQAAMGALDEALITGDYRDADRLLDQLERARQADGGYAPNLAVPRIHQNVGFDDNAWVGLDFIQAYRQTHKVEYLTRARGALDYLLRHVDKNTGLILEFEGDPNDSENATSTAPTIELALYVYEVTKDPRYFRAALEMYEGVNQYCRDSGGLYDGGYHLKTGKVDRGDPKARFSATASEVMIGVNLAFFHVTGDARYLDEAVRLGKADVAKWSVGGADDMDRFRPRDQMGRYLLMLYGLVPNAAYRTAVEEYADDLWNENRDPKSGLFTVGTPGPSAYYPAGYDITDQGAAEQLFALLAVRGRSLYALYNAG